MTTQAAAPVPKPGSLSLCAQECEPEPIEDSQENVEKVLDSQEGMCLDNHMAQTIIPSPYYEDMIPVGETWTFFNVSYELPVILMVNGSEMGRISGGEVKLTGTPNSTLMVPYGVNFFVPEDDNSYMRTREVVR